MIRNFLTAMAVFLSAYGIAQEGHVADSIAVEPKNEASLPLKLHHAEPLYIDLMRDLGARKGEKEWNFAMGVTENGGYYELTPLVEYEWAPMDRLGLEVEVPFVLYSGEKQPYQSPGSRMEGLKIAGQYTFLVSEKYYTSMAVGYINELEFNAFKDYNKRILTGNIYNPFFVVAKGWGKDKHWSTLIYTGPQFIHHFEGNHLNVNWQINTSVHYLIPHTKNFIGLEIDKDISKERFNLTLRPQMRVAIKDNLVLGLVAGIPTNRTYEGFSGFARLIYEPPHKDKKKH